MENFARRARSSLLPSCFFSFAAPPTIYKKNTINRYLVDPANESCVSRMQNARNILFCRLLLFRRQRCGRTRKSEFGSRPTGGSSDSPCTYTVRFRRVVLRVSQKTVQEKIMLNVSVHGGYHVPTSLWAKYSIIYLKRRVRRRSEIPDWWCDDKSRFGTDSIRFRVQTCRDPCVRRV